MTLQRLPDGSVRIARLDDWHLDALRHIPVLADPGDDEKALHRVYPAPFAAGEATTEQQEDWAEFVQPELETLFEGSVKRVARDLKKARLSDPPPPPPPVAPPAPGNANEERDSEELMDSDETADSPPDGEPAAPEQEWELTIPAGHVEDWFRAMNQARLVLSASKGAHRTDQEHVTRMLVNGEIEMLVRYEMLTAMCGWWVEVMMRDT
jgi:hypothetical protein